MSLRSRTRFDSWLPGLGLVRRYRRADLGRDAFAAVVLTAVLIPTGMGYAQVAGLPPVMGLYATVVALLAYALTGPSRILVIGPDSSLAPVIGAAILPLAVDDAARAVALAGLLAVLVGMVLLAGGALRLGFAADLLSKPIRLGYLNGVAATVIVSQLPKLFGFSVPADGIVDWFSAFVDGVGRGRISAAATVIGLAALGTIVLLRRFAPKVPGLILGVGAGTLAVWWLHLDGVPVVGRLPRGLPVPAWDRLAWGDVGSLLPAAIGIALVAFADTGILSRALAARDGEHIDQSREMGALGFTNVACGALGGFPVSGSFSRTPVAREAGARTQMTSVVAAVVLAGLVLLAPGATAHFPASALAAVVIAAALSMADVAGMLRLARLSRTEFTLALVAFAGVLLVGVLRGIGVAVGLSLLAFVAHAWRPHMAELVRVNRRKGYHDAGRHPGGRRIPGLVIARFDAPLFFANGRVFADFVRGLVESADGLVRWVVVAAEPITGIDTTAADELAALDDHLTQRHVKLVFAELKGPVKDRLARYGFAERFGPERFFPTVGTAVSAYLAATGIPWVDWTDRAHGPGQSAPHAE